MLHESGTVYKAKAKLEYLAMELAESERSFEADEGNISTVSEYHRSVEAENDEFMSVDELQQVGIGAVDIQKLKLVGICTIKVGPSASIKNLHRIVGSSYDLQEKHVQGKRSFGGQGG